MGTQLLYPQEFLIERIGASPPVFSRRKSSGNCRNYYYSDNRTTASRSHRKPSARPDQKKRVPLSSVQQEVPSVSKRSSVDDSAVARSSGLAVEKVTILRRGQSLDSLPVAVKSDVYAGSAFSVVSPSPSALPLPSFQTKKQSSSVVFDDCATRDLRRLLRLE